MARKTTTDRFAAKTKHSPSGCIEWTGSLKGKGYGYIMIDGAGWYAHRLAWTLANGPIPSGKVIDHKCGDISCANQDHLRAVTQKQNTEHRTKVFASSGYRGVHWDKKREKWEVRVRAEGIGFYGGHFADIEEANRVAVEIRNEVFTHNDLDRVA